MESLGIPTDRIFLAPYVVDNAWWTNRAAKVDRAAVRRAWGVPSNAPVVLFCAKLQPWKRPRDLLRAFAAASVPDAYLVFAGEGPLRSELEAEARALGLSDHVRFLGFTNQTQLPDVYCASDLMVLPSEYEPFGVVVNEAMLCGCPVVVSDRVGAREDLIAPGQNGFVFRSGDVEALAKILRENLAALDKLRAFDEAARRRMQSWSPADNIDGLVDAVKSAMESRFKVQRYTAT
jgi:glycosyltransferase involved in cell wall biosynthesis